MENSYNTDVVSLLDRVILELRELVGAGRNMENYGYEVINSQQVENTNTVFFSCWVSENNSSLILGYREKYIFQMQKQQLFQKMEGVA